jgi:hypothetical protein
MNLSRYRAVATLPSRGCWQSHHAACEGRARDQTLKILPVSRGFMTKQFRGTDENVLQSL